MPRTADFIAEQQSVKQPQDAPKRKPHPNSLKNLVAPWKPGQTGNPGGKNGRDRARELAQAIFENNSEAAYRGLAAALLKGNAYVFKELAERAYGKLKETRDINHTYQEVADAELSKRIADLERDLGLARAIDEAGTVGLAQAGMAKTNGKIENE